MLSHNGSRTHLCPTCKKSFSFNDEISLCPVILRVSPSYPWPARRGLKQGSTAKYAARACANCARIRLRSDGKSSCARYLTKELNYSSSARFRCWIAPVSWLDQRSVSTSYSGLVWYLKDPCILICRSNLVADSELNTAITIL